MAILYDQQKHCLYSLYFIISISHIQTHRISIKSSKYGISAFTHLLLFYISWVAPWHQCCPHMNKNLVAWGLPLLKQPKNSHVDGSITIHRKFMAKIHGFFETPSGPPQDLFQRGQQSFWTPEVCPVALPHVSKRLQRTGFGSAVELVWNTWEKEGQLRPNPVVYHDFPKVARLG